MTQNTFTLFFVLIFIFFYCANSSENDNNLPEYSKQNETNYAKIPPKIQDSLDGEEVNQSTLGIKKKNKESSDSLLAKRERIIKVDEDKIISYVVDPSNQDLNLYWKDTDGQNYKNIKNLILSLREENKELIFAMNGGNDQCLMTEKNEICSLTRQH